MVDLIRSLWGTLLLRPYVFLFLAAYLLVAWMQMGWRRTVVFTIVAAFFGFASEALALRTGFPFGHYQYFAQATQHRELWLAGVPVMDFISFSFLAYAGLATALLAWAPLTPGPRHTRLDLRIADLDQALLSRRTLLLAPLFTLLLDVVIDPVALLGDRWFLGRLYDYAVDGPYFGVPLTNFAGWLLVSFLIVLAFQAVVRRVPGPKTVGNFGPPALPGLALYAGVLAFNIVITFAIGELVMGLASTLVSLAILGRVIGRLARL